MILTLATGRRLHVHGVSVSFRIVGEASILLLGTESQLGQRHPGRHRSAKDLR
jgi:hypothetical protein